MMMKSLGIALISLGLLAACSKKEPAPSEPRPEVPKAVSISAESTPEAPPPPTGTAAAPAIETAPAGATPGVGSFSSANPGQDEVKIVEDLQAALQAYYLANVNSADRFAAPKTLDELVKKGLIKKIPTPPPGKKIVYHPENWQVTIENAGP